MNNSETKSETLAPTSDDLIVESVGNEIRFWRKVEGSTKVRQIAVSATLMRYRYLIVYGTVAIATDTDPNPEASDATATVDAPDLTTARLFGRADQSVRAALAAKYFPWAKVIHFYYAGRGPSGTCWGFYPNSHHSVRVSDS